MATELASSIFSKGPSDEFAAVDAYVASGESIVNSLPLNKSSISDIFKSVKFTNKGFDALGTAKALSDTVLGEQLKEGVKSLGLKYADLPSAVINKTKTLLKSTPINAQAMICSVGDYTSKVSFSDAMRIGKLGVALSQANGVTDVIRTINKTQNAAVLTNLIGEGSDIGATGVLTSLRDTIAENGALTRVVKGTLPFVLKNSDISLLREVTGGAAGGILNSMCPGFTKEFSSLYSPKYSYNLNTIASYNAIFDSFDQINTVWDKASHAGESIGSILGIISGTPAFKTLLGSGVAWILKSVDDENKKKRAQEHALARIYAQSTVSSQIKMYFPRVVMIGKYNRKSQKDETLDIRLIGQSIGAFLS